MKNKATLTLLVLNLIWLAAARPSFAQTPQLATAATVRAAFDADSLPGPNPEKTSAGVAGGSSGSDPSNSAAEDHQWHFTASPYLWLTGVHGTVGALNRDVSVHASPIDLLSNFRFGLMGTFEARHKRFVLPLDIVWARLGDDKALPFPNLAETTADLKAQLFILTPKVGVRVIDSEKIKIDALAGIRYWHLGQSVEFSPSPLGLNFSQSQNWVDPVVGGRIELPLASKIVTNIFGDVGGWGTGSQLEYQAGGVLGYKIKPKWTLQVGYRYLDVDYRGGSPGNFLFDAAMSGVIIGATINLK